MQYRYAIILAISFWLFACSSDKSETETVSSAREESGTALFAENLQVSGDMQAQILELQNEIRINPTDQSLRENYCRTGLLPEQNAFISAGIGLKFHPENRKAIPAAMAERAALMDARRWAFYADKWVHDNPELQFGSVSGSFEKTQKIISRIEQGDSLIIILASEFK